VLAAVQPYGDGDGKERDEQTDFDEHDNPPFSTVLLCYRETGETFLQDLL
jgi:hypothetical protein